MAEVRPEKSTGLTFAERQLLRHGWEHGKGLGRAENGISEPIKVKVKSNKGGMGHKEGEQFSFHWWDHIFNKASSSLEVETDSNGIKLKKTTPQDGDGAISNKKPRKASLAKAKLYGCFVKSATLLSGQEQPEPKASGSDDGSSSSSSEDDDERLDLSSTTRLSDSDLLKACGGRTAHKGARHGLTMSAKLARLEQQEAEFMAKYCKKSQSESSSPLCVSRSPTTEEGEKPRGKKQKLAEEDGVTENGGQPKKKKKKKKKVMEAEGGRGGCVVNGDEKKSGDESPATETEAVQTPETEVRRRRKKKKRTVTEEEEVSENQRKKHKKDKIITEEGEQEEVPRKKKKKKSRD